MRIIKIVAFITIISLSGATRAEIATEPNVNSQPPLRHLRVVLYPFIPGFEFVAEYVKRRFEAENPGVVLDVLDLRSNYYSSSSDNYVGNVSADVIELDSVFLRDFVSNGKIQEIPKEALLSPDQLLRSADKGTRLDGKRYGAAHWVCRDFLFYASDDAPEAPPQSLSDLSKFIGSNNGLAIDLRGKSTLGEYYLVAAFDRYKDWNNIYPGKIEQIDADVEADVLSLSKLCKKESCRNSVFHDFGGTHGAEFARKLSKALIGYSESLHDVLAESALCSDPSLCLSDGQIDVTDLPLDDAGSKPMAWVDSFTISAATCKAVCVKDAANFIRMMNRDDTYMALLFPKSLSFLKVPSPGPLIPAYLLPAKASLYSDQALLKSAHLYPKLRTLVEDAEVPTDINLSGRLRTLGGQLDKDFDKTKP